MNKKEEKLKNLRSSSAELMIFTFISDTFASSFERSVMNYRSIVNSALLTKKI